MQKRARHLMKRITIAELETSKATIAVLWRHIRANGYQRTFEIELALGGRHDAHLRRLMQAGFLERTGSQKSYTYRAVQGKDEVKPDKVRTVNEIRSRLSEMHKMVQTAIGTGLTAHAFEALRMMDKELAEIRSLLSVKHVGHLTKQTDAKG